MSSEGFIQSSKYTSYISYLTQVKDSQSSTLDAACSVFFLSCSFANSQRTLRPSSGSSYQGQGLHLVHIWSGLPIYQGQGQGQVRRLPALSPLSRFCKLTDSLGQGLLLLGQGKESEKKFFFRLFHKFVIFLKCFAIGNFFTGNLYWISGHTTKDVNRQP